jgi:hypothetical protein
LFTQADRAQIRRARNWLNHFVTNPYVLATTALLSNENSSRPFVTLPDYGCHQKLAQAGVASTAKGNHASWPRQPQGQLRESVGIDNNDELREIVDQSTAVGFNN